MSYQNHPIEIHLKGRFNEVVDSYDNEYQAVQAIPTLLAEFRQYPEDYTGHHLLIVRHEVDGMQEWHEPIEKFEIFS
jgi:hypothetical protein